MPLIFYVFRGLHSLTLGYITHTKLLDVLITGFHPSLLQNVGIALIFFAMSMSLFKKQPKALPKRNNKADGV